MCKVMVNNLVRELTKEDPTMVLRKVQQEGKFVKGNVVISQSVVGNTAQQFKKYLQIVGPDSVPNEPASSVRYKIQCVVGDSPKESYYMDAFVDAVSELKRQRLRASIDFTRDPALEAKFSRAI